MAVGGGALGDPAGFLAATYLRGVPWIGVPTTLVAQVDSSLGGKTGVDLPEGKNLVGAFHHPASIVLDVAALRSLPERQLRAALGEVVKMAALGDEALFQALEEDGEAVATGADSAFEAGIVAEVVERSAWAKVAVVTADEREQGGTSGRIRLNLGHTVGHALEAADGYATLLHGEAVAYGLRAATRIGMALGVTPADRAARIEALLTSLRPGGRAAPLPGRGGARGDGRRQEACGRAAALGPADRRRVPGARRRAGRRGRCGRALACWPASRRSPRERHAGRRKATPPTDAEREAAAVELLRIRDRIDELDRDIVALLNERASLGRDAGRAKHVAGRRALRDPEREREVLLRVAMANPGPLSQADLLSIYRRIVSATRSVEHRDRTHDGKGDA